MNAGAAAAEAAALCAQGRTRVRIFYPADPLGVVPGGIDTFIRGIIKWAPEDLDFSLVGMTTDPLARPPGRWTRCMAGRRAFDFFPAVTVADAGTRGRIPLSLRFMRAAWQHRVELASGFDVFDFHRVEPALLFRKDARPKNAFFHQDPDFVRQSASDNLWRHLPGLYQRVEAMAAGGFSSLWCVRESGVATLRRRYPASAGRTAFVPTWVDSEVFGRTDPAGRAAARSAWSGRLGLDPGANWIVTVGRLDTQKNPQLMLEALSRLCRGGHRLQWLVVGDGVLRADLERRVARDGLSAQVRFLGLQPPPVIADLLQAADLFALPSAYEGMPMALLEALGCGLPAVATDVGEVRKVLHHGRNGVIARGHDPDSFAAALDYALGLAPLWLGAPAAAAVAAYGPEQVLAPVYANYRRLAAAAHSAVVEHLVAREDPAESRAIVRSEVIGVRVDALSRRVAMRCVLDWARRREGRTAVFCNAHSAVHANRNPDHHQRLQQADLVAPDGAPVAWSLGLKRQFRQERIDGPDMMWDLCRLASQEGIPIGFHGATPEILARLCARVRRAFPTVRIVYAAAPPFGTAALAEDVAICDAIRAAGPRLLFVGLGCPKQERWMADHRDRLQAVLLGVGAAFEFHAGTRRRAPAFMRRHGLEWLHRLVSEPRRLAWRYLRTNTLFVLHSLGDAAAGLRRRVRLRH